MPMEHTLLTLQEEVLHRAVRQTEGDVSAPRVEAVNKGVRYGASSGIPAFSEEIDSYSNSTLPGIDR